jgi:MFS family permease
VGVLAIDSGSLKDRIVHSVTLRIVRTSVFCFFCYLAIGLLLATLSGFVHLHLGLSTFWAGVAVSSQYVATLLSRPKVGRMSDVLGPRTTVLFGQLACLISGLLLLMAVTLEHKVMFCFGVLLMSRLVLGCGESGVATGTVTWGLGRVKSEYAAQVISWNGIASYGGMAIGAPLGLWLANTYGMIAIGAAVTSASLLNFIIAQPLAGVPILRGDHLPFRDVLRKVFVDGLGLALGTVGFGTIASFTALYYASRHWREPALAMSLFGVCFIATRLIFADTINRWGGFRVAMVSFFVEAAGLFILWSATSPDMARVGAALSGCGFALVFPALGVEAVKAVEVSDRGSALGLFAAFLDLAMAVTGPLAGFIIAKWGYAAIFLYGSAASACAFVMILTRASFQSSRSGEALRHLRKSHAPSTIADVTAPSGGKTGACRLQ